jgi:hypothetical protein
VRTVEPAVDREHARFVLGAGYLSGCTTGEGGADWVCVFESHPHAMEEPSYLIWEVGFRLGAGGRVRVHDLTEVTVDNHRYTCPC